MTHAHPSPLPRDDSDPRLKRGVGLLGVVTFGAGTAIGVSIFTVLQPAAAIAGSGLLAAVLIAAIPMVIFALVYAFMSSALPKSGASFEWPSRFVHPLFGFLVAWLRILGSIGALVVLSLVLVRYAATAGMPGAALGEKPMMAAVITAIFVLNFLGVSLAARAQNAMMAVLVAALAVFVATGVPHMDLGRIGPIAAQGWWAVVAAIPLMITLFLGIETATEIGEEVRDPKRTIPRGIALAVLLTGLIYFAICLVALALLGPSQLAESDAPLLEAAESAIGAAATPVIMTAALVAILNTLNAIVLIFSRYLFAMGRSGVLPSALGRVHSRFGTPHVALLVAYGGTLGAILLPSDLVFLLLAVNIPTMLKYLATCLSALRMVRRHPDLHATAALKWSAERVQALAIVGILASAGVILVGIGADWRPYVLVAVWGLVGLAYWAVRRPRTPLPDAPASAE